MTRQAVEDIYPLSPLQEGLLFHALSGNKGLYFEQLRCILVGALDLAAFTETWRRLVARHAVLRTAFDWEDAGAPVQVVLDRVELSIVHHDWRALSPVERQERLAALLTEDLERGFELDEPPLFRLTLVQTGDDLHRLVWSFHHLLLDGWSSPLLLDEAFTIYDAVRRGEEPHLPPVRPYRDYVAWLKAQDLSSAQGFWRRLLEGFTRPTRPQIDLHHGTGTEAVTSHSRTLELDAGRTAQLLAFARRHQLTLNTLVQGAWARLLSCYGESDDVLFGITVSGRPPQLRGVETMVGLFINSLPLRLQVPSEEPLLPWLLRLRRLQVELQQFEATPLAEVQRWSEIPAGEPLFESLLVFENYPLGKGERKGSLELRDLESSERTNYPLTLAALPGERLELVLFYDGDRFEPVAIERLAEHLSTLLHTLADDPERRLGQWSLLGESERRQLLAPWHPAVAAGEHWQAMPSIRPRVYLLDRALAPIPPGLRGMVFLAGDALPAGDRRGPWETAEQFLPDPFSALPGARMARTGDLGRRTLTGDLERAGAIGRWVWIGERRVDTAAIEAALLADPAVDDIAVIARPTLDGPRLVAYVVSSGPWQPERLRAHLGEGPATPEAFVPVARLPLLPDGAVDEAALGRLAILDDELIARWEESLRSLPEVEAAAVVIGEISEALPPLHLDDLLPGWKATAAGAAGMAGDAGDTAGGAGRPAPAAADSSATPAERHGPALVLPADAPTILAAALERAARKHPNNGITYLQGDGPDVFQSYPELLEAAQRLLAGLRELGLKPQDKVLFQLDRQQDFVLAFWASMLGGFIPVPLSIAPTYEKPNAVVEKLVNAWRMLNRPWILCGRELLPALHSLSGLLDLSGLRVAAIDDLCRHRPDPQHYACKGDDLALLLLTSGSTGLPKAVMQTHRALLTRSAATAKSNTFTPEDVSLNWMPLDHVGGIVMFNLRDVYVGCRQVHAPIATVLADPLRWLDWIERFRATLTWAPNFAFGLVNDRAEQIAGRRWDLSSMRFILNAGEAIVARTARTFLAMLAPHGLQGTTMKPAWGMSETCSAITFSHDFSLASTRDADSFVEVGLPVPEAAVRIVDAEDRVVSEGAIGRLQVKGPMITGGYYQRPELNAEVFTADGWFDTGDLGVLSDGRLSITGRAKDVIIVHGVNYYSHEIEAVVEEVLGVEVSYTAACPVREAGSNTDELAIFFHTPDEDWERRIELIREIRNRVAEKSGLNPTYVIPMAREEIPKTAIGKIQRPQLRQQLEAGKLKDVLKRIDLLTGSDRTLPDWFYHRLWRRKREPASPGAIGAGLVFADPAGVGAELCRRLRRPDRPWVHVELGTGFVRLERDRYQTVPGNREQHRRLLRSLARDGIAIDHVVHLGTYGEPDEIAALADLERAQERGLYDLLHLVQALAEARDQPTRGEPPRRLSLLVVASHAQAVAANDPVAAERVALLGLVKTVPQEMPWLRCRHLDLPLADGERNVSRVCREIAVLNGDREVAWRHGRRHVAGLERLDLPPERNAELPFERGEMVLLTGGLGGIGREIADYLLREQGMRLLLVGRTPLASDIRGAELRAGLAALGRKGEVAYEDVDVADEGRLHAVVEAAETRWQCQLRGVIHLAGVLRECLLAEETRDDMAAALRPKVAGTWVLSRLLADRPGSFFIGFSSINSFFGGATMGAYAAANAYLEGLFDALARRGEPPRGTCLAWSMWDEVGMSRGYPMKDLSRARGYEVLSPRQGLLSFLAALRCGERRLIVGLTGGNRHVRRFAETDHYALEDLTGFFTSRGGTLGPGTLPTVADRFGVQSRCGLQQLTQLPRLATGEIDRDRLRSIDGSTRTAASARTAPRSELERQLAVIWQQVLGGSSPVGVDDNFFQLGGDSILSIQLVSRAREIGLQLTTQDVFHYPTIAELAAHARTASSPSPEPESVFGEVPLTPIQHWFFERPNPNPHHFNQALIFTVRERLDSGVLDGVVAHLLGHHDALRLHFAPGETGWKQWSAGAEAALPVIQVDLSALPAAAMRRAIESAAGQLQRSLHLSAGPLLRVAWFDGGDDRAGRLLIILHHLVVDGVSWRILVGDLERLYQQLRRGEPGRLQAKTTSFQRWAELLSALARSDDLTAEMGYWLVQERQRVTTLPRDIAEAGEANDDLAARTVTTRLDAEETRALLQDVHRAYRTRIDDVLLTGLALAFSRFTGQGSLLVDLEGHGREDLFPDVDLSRTVGWFTALFPVLLVLPGSASLGEALKAVKEQLRQIPRRGVGFGLLRYLRDDPETTPLRQLLPAAEVSFNYLGQTDQVLSESSPFAMAGEEIGPYSDPRGERRHLINVYGQTTGGRLEIHWTYSENVHHRATIERLANDFLAALRTIVDYCHSGEAFGYSPSDFPLARLNQAQLDRLIGGRRGVEDLYPLVPMQQGLLFHALYSPDSWVYFDQLSCTLVGDLDLPAFERAWRQVLARHSILRTAFVWSGLEEALQRVEEQVALPLEQLDWRSLPATEQRERLRRFLAADRERGFDLEQAPLTRVTLIRTAEGAWRLVWSSHHLLLDGWSRPLLLDEFFTLYAAASRGEDAGLAPAGRFRDYVAWLKRQDLTQAEAFWRRQLAGFTRPTPLGIEPPTEPPAASEEDYTAAHHELDAALTESLKALARQHQLTLSTLVQGAWGLLLARYSGEQEVLFGTTVSGRPSDLPGVETMVGLFINSLPLRLNIAPAEPLLPWLKRLQDLLAAMRQYEYTPLNMVQGWSDVPRGLSLFDSLLVFENYPMGESLGASISGLEIRDVDLKDRTNYLLTLVVIPGEKLTFEILYDGGRFDGAAIRRLMGHLETLLRGMTEDVSRSLGQLPLMAEEEKREVLAAAQRKKRLPAHLESLLRKTVERNEKKGTPV